MQMSYCVIYFLHQDWSSVNLNMIIRWSQLNFDLKIAYEGPIEKFMKLGKILNKTDIANVKWKPNDKIKFSSHEINKKYRWFKLSSQTFTILRLLKL